PENTVPTSVFASCTLNDHRRALTVTTDYGTDPIGGQGVPLSPVQLEWTPTCRLDVHRTDTARMTIHLSSAAAGQ
ncbi:hypothetical protein ACWGLF_41275, partial [Streptomyces puniciscabiei]